jgi:hypothetical protein
MLENAAPAALVDVEVTEDGGPFIATERESSGSFQGVSQIAKAVKNKMGFRSKHWWQTNHTVGRNQARRFLLNQSMVRCQAKSAAALLYRSGVASQLKPCTAPG